MNDGSSMDDDNTIEQLVREARAQRGGKPAKYIHLEQFSEIEKLVAADVQLPFILKWLADEKKVSIVLNTLRKYVIFKIGRPAYEDYLKRNGWLKKKRVVKISAPGLPPPPVGDIPAVPPPQPVDVSVPSTAAGETKTGKNPLHALTVQSKLDDGNHIPHTKFEVDLN